MKRKELPLGIQGFKKIREGNYYYADKTRLIEKLVVASSTKKSKPGYYFLSRPRRFGKSLLVDTIRYLFEGKKELFEGLYIYDKWDWNQTHPVIRLSFGGTQYKKIDDIEGSVYKHLTKIEKAHKIPAYVHPEDEEPTSKGTFHFSHVISSLYEKYKKEVAILIDEYDLPLLDVLEDPKKAKEHCEYLRGLYGVLKEDHDEIHFTFVTGISMFSKVNLFSRINHLNDISVDKNFSTICGYTSHDLETVFAPEIKPYSMKKIKRWYDGYNWDPKNKSPRVFCPSSVLLLFAKDDFQNWWCDDSTPKHMYDLMKKNHITSLNIGNKHVQKSFLKTFDVENPDITILLFQLGYLTIRKPMDGYDENYLRLTFPNYEVAKSLSTAYLEHRIGSCLPANFSQHGPEILKPLRSLDASELQARISNFLSELPCNKNTGSKPPQYEWYYGDLMYALLVSHCSSITMEETTSHGRSDMVIREKNQVFVCEFKCINSDDNNPNKVSQGALQQIKDRKYGDRYRKDRVGVYAVSMVFGKKERDILIVAIEELTS